MKRSFKILLIISTLLMLLLLITSCSSGDAYKKIQKEGYNVSVKFDIGKGMFAGREELVLVDVFNLDNEASNANGQKEISLLSPDDELRGSEAFGIACSGHYFVGWYQNRYEVKDADGNAVTDDDGNTLYTYSDKWDFASDKLVLDPKGNYSANAPVLTLYAAWVPLTSFEIYAPDESGTFRELTTITASSFKLPQWNKSTGKLSASELTLDGKTLDGIYFDEACTKPVTDSEIYGNVDYSTGTLASPAVKLYTTWLDGVWYKIYNAQSFVNIGELNASYEICADLDFSNVSWQNSSFVSGTFNGTICSEGDNVYKLSNIKSHNLEQTSGGIFREIGDNATIKNVTFENTSYTITKVPFRTQSVSFGLFAGKVHDSAVIENVSFIGDCKISVQDNCLKEVSRRIVEAVFGTGNSRDIAADNIVIEGIE